MARARARRASEALESSAGPGCLAPRYAARVAEHPIELRATVAGVLDNFYWIANPTGYLISGAPRTLLVSMSTDF